MQTNGSRLHCPNHGEPEPSPWQVTCARRFELFRGRCSGRAGGVSPRRWTPSGGSRPRLATSYDPWVAPLFIVPVELISPRMWSFAPVSFFHMNCVFMLSNVGLLSRQARDLIAVMVSRA